jgi:group II intron reverse transcriptase/maturase
MSDAASSYEGKTIAISKAQVEEAYQQVKRNKGAPGYDHQSLLHFEAQKEKELYKIWNRLSSGSYFPPPLRTVMIPKASGAKRPLGIPTVGDRVAQMVIKTLLDPYLEPLFHPDSYGYRPKKSAHQALAITRSRCWKQDWILDLDIRAFFEQVNHLLLNKMLQHYVSEVWILRYLQRWIQAPVEQAQGVLACPLQGLPQGGVISPLLANLYLHVTLDSWLRKHFPHVKFARYADDMVLHLSSEHEAQALLQAIRKRLAQAKLSLNESKTHIVYCKDSSRKGNYPTIQFDFLGYTFRPRAAKDKQGKGFTSFLPALSPKARKTMNLKMKQWNSRQKTPLSLEAVAQYWNPILRGWITYYGKFYPSALHWLKERMDELLVRWMRAKYKRFRYRPTRAFQWLKFLRQRQANLFVYWALK